MEARLPMEPGEALTGVEMFSGLEPEARRRVIAAAVPCTYRKGQVLFAQDEPGDTLIVLKRGAVAVYRTSPSGDRALLTVLYATGCRASEVTGLRLKDLQLDQGFCRCTGKGNKERIVSLNPVARAAIEAYLRHERPALAREANGDEPLFVTRTGRSLSRIVVWEIVKKYAARIGCGDKVSPHTLRHSFATHMLAGGAEIRALQEMLGHASIRTTQIYTQVEHSRLKNIHAKCHPRG